MRKKNKKKKKMNMKKKKKKKKRTGMRRTGITRNNASLGVEKVNCTLVRGWLKRAAKSRESKRQNKSRKRAKAEQKKEDRAVLRLERRAKSGSKLYEAAAVHKSRNSQQK